MSQRSRTSLPRSMGVVGLTLFGISYMAIGTVFTTYGIVNQLTEGHLVASYVVALVVMLFTASSYSAMVRRYPVAGSAYTYAQQSFGGGVGFLTGWILLLDYLFIPMINFLILGLYANTQFPAVPVWVFTLGAIVVALILNVLGISLVSKVNTAVVLISFAAVVVFAFFAIKTAIGDPDAPGVFEPFLPGSAQFSPVLTGAAVLSLSFLGFDAVSTLSEEAKRPRRDIPIAIMVTTIVGGLLFIVVAWLGALAYHLPDWSAAPQALLDAAGAVLFDHVGGPILAGSFVFITVIGTLGAGLAGQAAVSRILFSMGRDGILPRPLGGLSKKYGTPVVATALVSLVALAGVHDQLRRARRLRDGESLGHPHLSLPAARGASRAHRGTPRAVRDRPRDRIRAHALAVELARGRDVGHRRHLGTAGRGDPRDQDGDVPAPGSEARLLGGRTHHRGDRPAAARVVPGAEVTASDRSDT
ncbi:MAG: amino acid transporter, partial [Microbacterium sp.]|nr:amino acid transporter [Microbacterium sp.]